MIIYGKFFSFFFQRRFEMNNGLPFIEQQPNVFAQRLIGLLSKPFGREPEKGFSYFSKISHTMIF